MLRSRRLVSALATLVVVGLLTVGAPPSATALDSPGGLSVSDGTARILSWSRVPGATAYDVQVARTASFSPTLASVSTVNAEYVPTVQLPVGDVWWRVRAKAGSSPGDWTTSSFSTTSTAAPVPVRPLAGTTFQAPTTPLFTWEPVAGATSYTVQTGPDPAFVDPALIVSNKQDTTAAYLVKYPVAGRYYWRVQAELSTGYATEWSVPIAYDVEGLPPAGLEGPADSFGPEVTDVVLDWAPVVGAATYQLQVSTDENFLSARTVIGIKGTRWSPTPTLDNDEYYWRVRPVDASGNAAPWPAEPWKFRRAWSAQPVPTYPQGTLDPSRPFFYQWEPIERASKYTVLLFDETGTPICSVTTVHTTLAPTRRGECLPERAGAYRWRVIGIDDTAGVVTDQLAQTPTSFTYTPPPAVTPAPEGSLSVSDVTGHRVSLTGTAAHGGGGETCVGKLPATCLDLRQTPVLSWDPVLGATSYRVTLSYDRELTNRVENFKNLEVFQPLWTPPTGLTLPDSQAGSAYYWVVQPCSGGTCAPIEYPQHSFAKKTVAPAPASPAPDQVVSDDVTLSWGSALAAVRDPGAATGSALSTPGTMEARNYVVQVSLDPAFATALETTTVDQTTYTALTGTYPEGIVYWRVRAMDGANNPTVWSQARSFVKRSAGPEPLTPADGGALGQDYTLSWRPVAFAASYDVEVYAGATRVANANTVHSSWAPSTPYPASADGYTWRVRRVDVDGRKGEWSATRSFQFAGFPVSLAAPASGEVVPPAGARFTWVSDARATSYRFERRKPGTTDLAESVITRATAWAPTSALAGGTAQWRVVALDTAGKSLGASPWRDVVVVDTPRVVTPVTVAGSGEVGTDLRVYAPTFDPAAETISYQWYRGTTAIAGATGETYTVVAADVGKKITVKATGSVAGYKPATSTSVEVGAKAGGTLVAQVAPRIDGTGAVGAQLRVVPGTWSTAAKLSYQWYRDGVAISRSTGTTYRPTAADATHRITVTETATATGYDPGTATSAPVAIAKLASTLTLRLSATKAPAKQRVTATVTVTAAGVTAPGGTVSVYVGKKRVKVLKLGTKTTATLKLPRQRPGTKKIRAVYSGGAQILGATAKARLKVTRR